MMRLADRLLDTLTMYRLTVYGLVGLSLAGLGASLLGRLAATPLELVVSFGLIAGAAWPVNALLAGVWRIPVNRESWLITALILILVVQPVHDVASGLALVLAGIISSASKFLIAPLGKHIFNPAAFAAASVSLFGLTSSSWWVGSSALWPFTFVVGLAIILKIRRYALAAGFAASVLVVQTAQFALMGHPILGGLTSVFTASPLLFLGGVMLTEPSTMPPRRASQAIFGAIVGTLFVVAPAFGPFIVYPEVALLVGNLYAYIVSPKRRYRLTLKAVEPVSPQVATFVFTSDYPLAFQAGQYLEWTLGHVPGDGRGNRRSFTIASAPEESDVRIGLKFYEPPSAFKQALARLQPGDTVLAGQVSGSFTLDEGTAKKYLFIAGGVGITPFRSMVRQLIDEGRTADIVLLYTAADSQEFLYRDVFAQAAAFGVRTVLVSKRPHDGAVINGTVSPDFIAAQVPDYGERTVYVSGPNAMVQSLTRGLRTIGVPRRRIHTDYFSGY